MEEKFDIKRRIILGICILLSIVIIIWISKIIVFNVNINREMKTAQHAITMVNTTEIYPKAKIVKKHEEVTIGTEVYILKCFIDKDEIEWCKIKYGRKVGYVLKENLGVYEHKYSKKNLMVDVSKFNLENNFKNIGEFKAMVIKNNIKFVYIRGGGRGYGQAGNMYEDKKADEYAKACEFLGVPFGYYFLEEALNSAEVDEEIEFINNFVRNHQYKNNVLPIALDVEKHIEKGRADDIWDTRSEIINEMIKKLNQDKKKVILYSNANIANEYLEDVDAAMWLAYYPKINEIPSYWYSDTEGDAAANKKIISKLIGWQFTESGIDGIINEKVDISVVYSDALLNGNMDDIKKDMLKKNEMVFGPINSIKEIIGHYIK